MCYTCCISHLNRILLSWGHAVFCRRYTFIITFQKILLLLYNTILHVDMVHLYQYMPVYEYLIHLAVNNVGRYLELITQYTNWSLGASVSWSVPAPGHVLRIYEQIVPLTRFVDIYSIIKHGRPKTRTHLGIGGNWPRRLELVRGKFHLFIGISNRKMIN